MPTYSSCTLQATVIAGRYSFVEESRGRNHRNYVSNLPIPWARTPLSIDTWVNSRSIHGDTIPGPEPGQAMSMWATMATEGGPEAPIKLWQRQCDVFNFNNIDAGKKDTVP